MAWTLDYSDTATKQLKKLDKTIAGRIDDFLGKLEAEDADPRQCGESLTGDLSGRWRYRVGKYRIVCEIRDSILIVLVLNICKRETVYNRKRNAMR